MHHQEVYGWLSVSKLGWAPAGAPPGGLWLVTCEHQLGWASAVAPPGGLWLVTCEHRLGWAPAGAQHSGRHHRSDREAGEETCGHTAYYHHSNVLSQLCMYMCWNINVTKWILGEKWQKLYTEYYIVLFIMNWFYFLGKIEIRNLFWVCGRMAILFSWRILSLLND